MVLRLYGITVLGFYGIMQSIKKDCTSQAAQAPGGHMS